MTACEQSNHKAWSQSCERNLVLNKFDPTTGANLINILGAYLGA